MTPHARKNGMVLQEVGNELLIYEIGHTHARLLNPLTAQVWRNADGSRSVDDFTARFCQEVDADASEDMVRVALAALSDADLLRDPFVASAPVSACSDGEMVRQVTVSGELTASSFAMTSIVMPAATQARSDSMPTYTHTAPVPTQQPSQMRAAPVPTQQPSQMRAAPVPTQQPSQMRAAPVPTQQPSQMRAAPVPTQRPSQMRAAPVPTQRPSQMRAAPVPTQQPSQMRAAPVPTQQPSQMRAAPVPTQQPSQMRAAPVPTPRPSQMRAAPVPQVSSPPSAEQY